MQPIRLNYDIFEFMGKNDKQVIQFQVLEVQLI